MLNIANESVLVKIKSKTCFFIVLLFFIVGLFFKLIYTAQ